MSDPLSNRAKRPHGVGNGALCSILLCGTGSLLVPLPRVLEGGDQRCGARAICDVLAENLEIVAVVELVLGVRHILFKR
jgi:hypothetical protein